MKLDRRTFIGAGGAAAALGLGALWGTRPSAAAPGNFPFKLSDAQWRQRLGTARYAVLRQASTERAGSSPLDHEKRRGTFRCAGCDQPLYSSSAKFESGTGWPSFYQALPGAIATREDNAFLMKRTEVLCRRCGGHLGHVFNDGPKPTGLRYCMNGLAMKFVAA